MHEEEKVGGCEILSVTSTIHT